MHRLALLADLLEEDWPSMDLVAEMLARHLHQEKSHQLHASLVRPAARRFFGRLPLLGASKWLRNGDRWLNRFWWYPRDLRKIVGNFEVFHVCDHSYAQLVHELPAERTGVYCHDLDAFRCLLEPVQERRSRWFRAMARRILTGLQKAAVVFYSTVAVGRELTRHQIVDPARLVAAPYGLSAEFCPGPPDETLGPPFLLHVGSCIPRKRVDVLLAVFAEVRRRRPELKLIQVGGVWTDAQRAQIDDLGLAAAVEQRRGLSRQELAHLYRQAAVVLQPSEAEGFGLPVLEALGCGAIVLASAIAPLRDVAGDAAVFRPVADVPAWSETVELLLAHPEQAPALENRLAQAQLFTWTRHAQIIADAYGRLLT